MTRPGAVERLRRVLAMIPWIAARDDPTIAEIARAFGVPEETVVADLELLPLCGLPPYTPDRLIEVWVHEDTSVSIRFAEYFARPLRLTPAEGFALLAAGRALSAVPGSDPRGPLARALKKLEAALGAHEVVDVEMGESEFVDVLRDACGVRERVEIDYYSHGRDAMTTRLIDPYRLVVLQGRWYLAAHCHLAGDERLFRIDRVRGARPTGEHFESPGDDAGEEKIASAFRPAPADVRVTVSLPPSARWVAESYPTESVEELKSGRLHVVLAVSARAFLERILLSVGPQARVLTPKSWRGVGADAARRVLARYRAR